MGFYAVDPVSANYVFGTPLFDKITIDMGKNRQFILEAKRVSANSQYIDSVKFNGESYTRLWFSHSSIAQGGHIMCQLSDRPNESLGSKAEAFPPSMTA